MNGLNGATISIQLCEVMRTLGLLEIRHTLLASPDLNARTLKKISLAAALLVSDQGGNEVLALVLFFVLSILTF